MKAFIVKILLGLLSWMGVYGAFTTLNSTDQLVNFPTTYNANITKTIEVGTTSVASITTLSGLTTASSLSSIGTITTGVWNGTTIAPANGGTGSTTLSANQILLGNGITQLGVVNGFGTSGQFLTSNGAATAPSWASASVNQTLDYVWTGDHTFKGNTFIKNLNASSTVANPITLNTVGYAFPSSQSTQNGDVLKNNGNGVLGWAQNATTTFSMPHPTCNASTTLSISDANNTTSQWGSFELPFTITLNTIYFNVTSVGVAGRYSIGIYNISGQKLASTTTSSISAVGLVTDSVSPAVTLPPGIYYVGFIPIDTASLSTTRWDCGFDYFSTISGKNRFSGRRTGESPASVLPSAPDFTALTQNSYDGLVIRLNN